MPFIVGESIGPYRLVEQLGQGGMASVFKAYHAALDRYVAIKVLHVAFLEDKNFLARFQREARVVARLDHQNIVPIYDFSEHEGRPYLVMKYVEGETLKARLAKGPLSQDEILRIVEPVGNGLFYAHKQGILHRDVKPSNVLLTEDGQIYLADFGLARIAQTGESSLTADRMVGTPQYMSPEQALARPDLDSRTDIYSFGVMLYEMLVGSVPFNADTPFAVIHDHIYTPLPLPSEANPDISSQVERVLLKTLAKDKDDRFEDVHAMVDALKLAFRDEYFPSEDGGPMIDLLDVESVQEVPGVSTVVSDPTPELFMQEFPAAPETEAVEPVSAEPAAESDVSAKPKKKRRGLKIALGIIGALIIGFLCLATIGGILDRINERKAADALLEEPAAEEMIDPEFMEEGEPEQEFQPEEMVEENLPAAEDALRAAVQAWRDDNMKVAADEIRRAFNEAGLNRQFYGHAFEYMAGEDAWLMIAVAFFESDRPVITEYIRNNVDAAHEVLYYAADDPKAGAFFERNKGDNLFAVAPIRYELHFGDPMLAKEQLGEVLDKPIMMERFPEAELLEVETFLVLEDWERARLELDQLLGLDDLPDWVRNFAFEIEKGIELP